MAIKLFIVDDHYMLIEGIRSLMQQEKTIELIGHAMNGESCLAFLKQQQPDVILMDINLPGMSGIELCELVKTKYPPVAVIGLSTFNQLSYIQKMVDNGASGYILKNASQQEMMMAIETVAKGKTYMSDDVARVLSSPDNNSIVITRREKEVLALIAEGLTNNEIAQKLFISLSTVDTHRKNLLAKFQVKNSASLVKTAATLGML